MTNKKFLVWGMLAMVLALGMVLAGCDTDTDSGGGGTTTTYTVAFDVGDGSGTPPASQTVNAGQSITLPNKGSMTAPSGKSFNGWRTGGQNYAAGDSYTVNGNVIFTAQWGTNGGGNEEPDGNPFIGTWSNDDSTLVVDDTTWLLSDSYGSSYGDTYTISGSTATFILYDETFGTATVSGNTLTVTLNQDDSVMTFTKPSNSGGEDNSSVSFSSVTADGSGSQTTSQLTLTFSEAITSLSADDITLSGVSGVSAGTLSGSNPYTLGISGHSAGGTLNVSVLKSGYTIDPASRSVTIYYNAGGSGATTKPDTPTNVTATALSPGRIQISWSAPYSGGTPDSYSIWTTDSSTGAEPYYELDSVSGDTTSYTDATIGDWVLAPSTKYYYKVSAHNSIGDSAKSTAVNATTLAWSAPANVTATRVSSDSIKVSWNAKSGAVSYKVYGTRIVYGTTWEYYLKATVPSDTSWTEDGLEGGHTYNYAVTAIHSDGSESNKSSLVSAVVPQL
jgi:hypothetical protein